MGLQMTFVHVHFTEKLLFTLYLASQKHNLHKVLVGMT